MGTGLDGNLDDSTQGTRRKGLLCHLICLGLIPRAVDYLMKSLMAQYGALEGSGTGKNPQTEPFFEIYTSFLEIYNEEIIDLLVPLESHGTRSGAPKRKSFSIREDSKGDIYLTGIREERIVSEDEIFALLQKGSLSRTTKSTEMNMVSSRSHAIFTLLLRQRQGDGQRVLASKLHFVDLAGSERLKRTQAQGDRVKESISINSGLLALGNVISALGDPTKRSTHIPYRNSKLTRLLQDSLGGNSRTLMIACASPSSDNFPESLNTLKYADRAKNIQNRVQINEETGGNGAFEVAQLKKQIASLKQEILHLRTSRRSDNNEGSSESITASHSNSNKPSNARNTIDQAEMARLRVQNSELKRRVTQMSKEKATIEAERDAYKTAAGPNAPKAASNVKIIAELKGRIAELETSNIINASVPSVNTNNTHNAHTLNAPQTPVWLRQANVLVNKARDEIQENLQTIRKIEFDNMNVNTNANANATNTFATNTFAMDEDEAPMTPSKSQHSLASNLSLSQHSFGQPGTLQLTQAQFAAAVTTRCEGLISRVRSDLALKEDLIRQFEICQAEYSSMRRNYDEKMRLVHENLVQAQKERDLAIKKATSGGNLTNSAPAPSISNRRYEEKIKALGKELNIARASVAESQRALQTRALTSEASMKSLRTQLESMRAERTKLLAKLAEETSRLKSDCFAHDNELTDLRQREYRATESARKLKKAYEFQKALLQKRIEQNHQARVKIRQLLLALKKQRSGSFVDELDIHDMSDLNDMSDSLDSTGDTVDSVDAVENVSAMNQVNTVDQIEEDEEVLLQLNEQTEAVLNEEITMMDIDPVDSGYSQEESKAQHSPTKSPYPANSASFAESQTGEMPRSALRHSPLISRRRDVFAKLEENKKNPFK